jgi:hypothetical protein
MPPAGRQRIAMDEDEVAGLLREERTMVCATLGRDGWPHLMPLWYVVRPTGPDGADELWAWTFAKSQKTRNLERDPRATLQVEAGETYAELRGVMLKTEVVIHRDLETTLALGLELAGRYGLPGTAVGAQAPKRVALQFAERDRATWDHGK